MTNQTQTQQMLSLQVLLNLMGVNGQPAPGPLVPASAQAISPRVAAIIEAQGRRANAPVRYMFSRPLFAGYELFEAPTRDWVLVNAAADPLYHDRHGFPMPASILARLQRLKAAGIGFPAIYVAHEVEKGKVRQGMPLDPAVLMPPDPAPMVETSKTLGASAVPLWRAATLPLLAARALAIGAAGVVGAVASLAALDPILFGVRTPVGQPVAPGIKADFFYLGHWVYNQNEEEKNANR